MTNVKKFSYFFHQYLQIISKRGLENSVLQADIVTSFIFDYLRLEWLESGWNVAELKYLCLALDASSDDLNPNKFVHFPHAYIDELKITISNTMDECLMLEAFDRGDYIPEEHIKKVTNYICGQLISWSPNRSYYECQYNYAIKVRLFVDGREQMGLLP